MQKWEYLTVQIANGKVAQIDDEFIQGERESAKQFFEDRGNEGWELVAASGYDNYYEIAYFKRPKAEKLPTLPPIRK